MSDFLDIRAPYKSVSGAGIRKAGSGKNLFDVVPSEEDFGIVAVNARSAFNWSGPLLAFAAGAEAWGTLATARSMGVVLDAMQNPDLYEEDCKNFAYHDGNCAVSLVEAHVRKREYFANVEELVQLGEKRRPINASCDKYRKEHTWWDFKKMEGRDCRRIVSPSSQVSMCSEKISALGVEIIDIMNSQLVNTGPHRMLDLTLEE